MARARRRALRARRRRAELARPAVAPSADDQEPPLPLPDGAGTVELPRRAPVGDVTNVQPTQPVEVYPRPVTAAELGADRDDAALTAELADALRKIPACAHCGGRHDRACPRVKRMKFHPNGSLAEVEFWPHGKWDEAGIIWPSHLETVAE